ncbi:MAG: COX15/CtaA family protein [Flavobacteriales bacterium]|nr:COX15/CtaA family protein [Flavobacteriales bacterium]
MSNASAHPLRPVVIWLLTGCFLIACMVAIGGITRLTGSGLSITEWKPIIGALPPMNEAEWHEAFDKYKQIPEYNLINQHMELDDFKEIFFWEFLHRNWGRLMGIVFIVPFVWFWRKGLLKGWLMRRGWSILIGGGLVGALGWFMVVSGLEDNPDVSQYRLAIHLCAAFIVFCLVLWTIFDIQWGRRSFLGDGTSAAKWSRWLLVIVLFQIIYGAFTAGLDAGRIYNTWPLMNGEFMPTNVTAFGSLWKDFTDHRDGVQFIHRNFAWVVAIAVIWFGYANRRNKALKGGDRLLFFAVVIQFALGVLTLITQVWLPLGVLHQLGALLLLSVLLHVLHHTGRIIPAKAVREAADVRADALGHRGQ